MSQLLLPIAPLLAIVLVWWLVKTAVGMDIRSLGTWQGLHKAVSSGSTMKRGLTAAGGTALAATGAAAGFVGSQVSAMRGLRREGADTQRGLSKAKTTGNVGTKKVTAQGGAARHTELGAMQPGGLESAQSVGGIGATGGKGSVDDAPMLPRSARVAGIGSDGETITAGELNGMTPLERAAARARLREQKREDKSIVKTARWGEREARREARTAHDARHASQMRSMAAGRKLALASGDRRGAMQHSWRMWRANSDHVLDKVRSGAKTIMASRGAKSLGQVAKSAGHVAKKTAIAAKNNPKAALAIAGATVAAGGLPMAAALVASAAGAHYVREKSGSAARDRRAHAGHGAYAAQAARIKRNPELLNRLEAGAKRQGDWVSVKPGGDARNARAAAVAGDVVARERARMEDERAAAARAEIRKAEQKAAADEERSRAEQDVKSQKSAGNAFVLDGDEQVIDMDWGESPTGLPQGGGPRQSGEPHMIDPAMEDHDSRAPAEPGHMEQAAPVQSEPRVVEQATPVQSEPRVVEQATPVQSEPRVVEQPQASARPTPAAKRVSPQSVEAPIPLQVPPSGKQGPPRV